MALGTREAEPRTRRRSSPRTFTKRAKETFLTELSTTAHVTRAAAAAGFSLHAAYAVRRRDPEFAAGWAAALADGYGRIESALIRRALGCKDHPPVAGDDDADADAAADGGALDVELAKWLLARHGPTVSRIEGKRTQEVFRATRDAAEATLLAKLRAHARAAGIAPPFARLEAPVLRAGEARGDAEATLG